MAQEERSYVNNDEGRNWMRLLMWLFGVIVVVALFIWVVVPVARSLFGGLVTTPVATTSQPAVSAPVTTNTNPVVVPSSGSNVVAPVVPAVPVVQQPVVSAAVALPVSADAMPSWLASHFGGTNLQWKQKTDQATGLKLNAWEFLSKNRELGIGDNVILGYGTATNAAEATGVVSYGIRNADGTGWLAGYLVEPGDFTVDKVGSKTPTAIDTATWFPGTATSDQVAARTPAR